MDADKKQARQIEVELDLKVLHFSKQIQLLTNGNSSNGGSNAMLIDQLQLMSKEISQLLTRLSSIIDSLSSKISPTDNIGHHLLQRHKEILFDHQKEYARLNSTLSVTLERQSLLSGSVNISQAGTGTNGGTIQDSLLNERKKIDGANRNTETLIQEAFEARNTLADQRQSLLNSSRRLGNSLSKFYNCKSYV